MNFARAPNSFHGFLPFDKPRAWTSAHAVARVKRCYHGVKVGHGGTLDPAATGLLPLALGRGTRLLSYVLGQTKFYCARVRLGLATTTADAEGEVTHRLDFSLPGRCQLERLLARFVGQQWQVPPMHSAVHHHGRRLYEYARQGSWLPRKPRRITIHSLRLSAVHEDGFSFLVSCSSGTYIRTLAEDLARMLSAAGHLAELRRLGVGALREEQMVGWRRLSSCADDQNKLGKLLLPLDAVLTHLPALQLGDSATRDFCRGRCIACPASFSIVGLKTRVYSHAGFFLGVAAVRQKANYCLQPQFTALLPV